MGMHYIAEKRLVHRVGVAYYTQSFYISRNFSTQDLAARNILVGKNETCKVGDFGLLRKLGKASSTDPKAKEVYVAQSITPLPNRWMAPESLDCDLKQFSTASDVWSFAVLQWEMKNVDSIPYSVSILYNITLLASTCETACCLVIKPGSLLLPPPLFSKPVAPPSPPPPSSPQTPLEEACSCSKH